MYCLLRQPSGWTALTAKNLLRTVRKRHSFAFVVQWGRKKRRAVLKMEQAGKGLLVEICGPTSYNIWSVCMGGGPWKTCIKLHSCSP